MKEGQIPFFARFLEGQDYPQIESDVKAGPGHGGGGGTLPDADQITTMKYPSDDDEGSTS
jgi:hypothetical protein